MNELSVLLIKDGGANWVAQCLQYDVAAQGMSMREAMTALDIAMASEVIYAVSKGKQPLQGIKPAPKHYWRLYEESAERVDISRRTPIHITSADEPDDNIIPPAYQIPQLRELRAA